MTEERQLLRPADVAALLGVTVSRVYQLLRLRELPAVRFGGSIRIPRPAWDAWLLGQRDRALQSLQDGDAE